MMCTIKLCSALCLLLTITFDSQARLQRSAGFSYNPKPQSEAPFKKIPILHGKASPVHGAAACVNDEMCLSYGMGDGEVISLYTGFVCRGGSRCLNTRCPAMEFMRYSRVLDMCYRLSEFKSSWSSANDTCMQQGGRLIVLNTDRKFDQFSTEYNEANGRSFWMGARLTGSRWYWINGEEIPLNNPNWHTGNPDLAGNACLDSGRFYHGFIGMADQPCYVGKYFVCEF